MGVEIRVEHLTKRFGRQTIWEDVGFSIPSSEISVLLGPSGTGKSVFLKSLIGLLKPNAGSIFIDGRDITKMKEHDLYETRKLFGVLFQDGALFGSQSIYDNIAFPLREHTKKREGEIKGIVMEKIEMVGLLGAEGKLPGEISGGMRKRAGLARALVLDPEIILCDEPDSGLDPVRTAFLNQLFVDLNQQNRATFLIVTHDINTARTLPDNIGLLYRRHLAMFGPRLQLLTSTEPVVRQFLNGRQEGPIGMAEEKDAALLEEETKVAGSAPDLPPLQPQLLPSNGEPRPTQLGPMLTRSVPVDDLRQIMVDVDAGVSDGGDAFVRDDRGEIIGRDRISVIVTANRDAARAEQSPPAPTGNVRRTGVAPAAGDEPAGRRDPGGGVGTLAALLGDDDASAPDEEAAGDADDGTDGSRVVPPRDGRPTPGRRRPVPRRAAGGTDRDPTDSGPGEA